MPVFCRSQCDVPSFHWYTPGSTDTRVTVAPFFGVPLHPVMLPNVLVTIPLYVQVPVTPWTVNVPCESKPVASATVRKVLDGSWPAPLTVVVVVIVTRALSSTEPVHLSPDRLFSTPLPVLV